MLFLFETTLFIQNHPVLYHVFIEHLSGKYFFRPEKFLAAVIYPPAFYAIRQDGAWQFDGITDYELKDQAVDDIHFYVDLEIVENT